jgi:hypothetical protein
LNRARRFAGSGVLFDPFREAQAELLVRLPV